MGAPSLREFGARPALQKNSTPARHHPRILAGTALFHGPRASLIPRMFPVCAGIAIDGIVLALRRPR